jgi:phage terminase large subunit GpA-like protein
MLTTIHIPRSAPWLPLALRVIPGPIRHRFRISEPEQKIFRKHKKIPVSKWCERYRTVTMSVLPGRWRNSVTPYLSGIMDASFFPSVQTVIVCKAPQVGMSEAANNCIGYAIDRDPGPVLYIYPDEMTARENSQDRIQPMIKTSPRLRGYMTGIDDDSSMLRISLQHMPIYMAWARSAARLANKPIRYLVFDETDKYVDTAGKRETDPISLGEARTITYRHNRKVWKISSPTTETGNIWKALTTEAQAIFDYWVRCPACNLPLRMEFKQIKWAHTTEPGADGKCHSEDPETIEAEKLAGYECPHCLAAWNDYDRDLAVRHGAWRDRKTETILAEYLKNRRPVKIGFHIPSWVSPFVSLSAIAASFLRGLTDMNKFKDFYNKHLAEPWKLTVISKNREQILAARCDLPAQTVPEAAIALTCGVDVQKFGFWFVVRAWAADMTNWNIHYGFLATQEDVENLIFESTYPVANSDRTMRIFRACKDTGGGEKYEDMTMTEETYFWLIKNRGRRGVALWGTKGSSSHLAGMLAMGNAILSTPSGKKLPEALRIISVDTAKAKDQFHYRLQLAINNETRSLPGAAFLHADTKSDYIAQILAEEKQLNDKGHEEWVNVHHRPNHLLDAEIAAAVCVEMEFPGGGLRLLAEHMKRKQEGPEGEEARKTPLKSAAPRTSWFKKR